MIRLYVPAEQTWTAGMTLSLPEATVHHWTRVLRARVADRAMLFDGQGHEATVELIEINKRSAVVSVLDVHAPAMESPLHTHLGLVMSKGDRLDYALQKAVELGVSEITLLTSERCELRLRGAEAVEKKCAHWQGVLISACEQSGRNTLPQLHGPMALSEWQQAVRAEQKWLMAPSVTGGPSAGEKPQTLALLIGPEGGLSAAEIADAQVCDFQPWQLGPRVLRTETAPVAALAVLQWLYGDAS
ncbi:MAG: 16S rRNA (uracil(1498)-N(3))-methyltransferase [Paraperlucidibaca sp.]